MYPFEASLNKIGHGLCDNDLVFKAATYQQRVYAIAKELGLEIPSVMQSMVIFKQPLIGGQVPWHQDASFIFTVPDSILGFWIPLEDATTKNGCLWVVPGGNKVPIFERFVRDPENGNLKPKIEGEEPFSTEGAIPLEMKRGSLLLIHSNLPHKSNRNTSNLSRLAYTFHMMDLACDFPEENWLQREFFPFESELD